MKQYKKNVFAVVAWFLMSSCNTVLAANRVENFVVVATPQIGVINFPQKKMVVFQVINMNNTVLQVETKPVSLLGKIGAFQNDSEIKGSFSPDLYSDVMLSPQRFVLAPHAMQFVRAVIADPKIQVGDSFFGANFSVVGVLGDSEKSASTKKKSPDKMSLDIETYVGQTSTVYVHHGKGKPKVEMTCNISYPKSQPAEINFNFKNTSVWMLRPEFSAAQNGKVVFDKSRVAPMMGMTEGTRQIQLPADTKAPLNVTWTSEEGVSGALTCNAAGS